MEKSVKIFNKIMEICLWGIVFFLPFSKAGVEIWLHLGLALWLAKRIIIGKVIYLLREC